MTEKKGIVYHCGRLIKDGSVELVCAGVISSREHSFSWDLPQHFFGSAETNKNIGYYEAVCVVCYRADKGKLWLLADVG